MTLDGIYPLGLKLRGRPVLVVGGGSVGLRRVHGLLAAGARVTLVSPTLTPALAALRDQFTWHERPYRSGDVTGSWLVIAATDQPSVNAEVAAAAEGERIFCVRADDANFGSAWTPASDRNAARLLSVWTGQPKQSQAWRTELAKVGLPEAATLGVTPGEVVLVGGGPGDPGLLTRAGWQAVQSADVIVCDHLGPTELLTDLPASVEVIDVGKLPYGPAVSQRAINDLLISRAQANERVVRLKGGDPFVFGRGGEEVVACAEAGVPVRVIPGVTSAIAGPALAGIPVTQRGIAQSFTVVSGHAAPGSEESTANWSAIAQTEGTVVVLMGVRHAAAIAAALLAGGRAAETPVAWVISAATDAQRVVRCQLAQVKATVASGEIVSPAVLVVGEVVG